MLSKAVRPSDLGLPPLTRPQNERTELSVEENTEFWLLVQNSTGMDWGTMRIWSHILFWNRGVS
jgi:hypothetical protein